MTARLTQSRVFEIAAEQVQGGLSLEDELARAFAVAVSE